MLRRLLLAVLAGPALWLAFPGHDLWFLAPVGICLLTLATLGVRPRTGAWLGFLGGMTFFLPVLSWSGIYVGPLPWVALCVLESAYVALFGVGAAILQRRGRVRPVAVALLWVATELARGTTPWGGFPWVRLAFSQADSPLARFAAVAGAPAISFVVALLGGLIAALVWSARVALTKRRVRGRGPALTGSVALAAGVLLAGAGTVIPVPTDGPTEQFLAVQGNVPQAGLDFNAQRRAVLDDHAAVTREAADQVRAGTRQQPAVVAWPENSSDIDPLINPDAREVIDTAVARIGAPTAVGAVLEASPTTVRNTSMLFQPDGTITASYDKRHPVPFAEYIPWRSFVRMFSDKVDLVSRDFIAGTARTTFDVTAADGRRIVMAPNICFEVAYDDLVRDGVEAGANVLLVQTNNATFGYTAESEQQLAISRIRAIEHGRSVVHISTVGVSALITPDGVAHQRTQLFTPALLQAGLPLRTELTLADRVGQWPELLATLAAAVLVAASWWGSRRARRTGAFPAEMDNPSEGPDATPESSSARPASVQGASSSVVIH